MKHLDKSDQKERDCLEKIRLLLPQEIYDGCNHINFSSNETINKLKEFMSSMIYQNKRGVLKMTEKELNLANEVLKIINQYENAL